MRSAVQGLSEIFRTLQTLRSTWTAAAPGAAIHLFPPLAVPHGIMTAVNRENHPLVARLLATPFPTALPATPLSP